jgi:hypothetical protein
MMVTLNSLYDDFIAHTCWFLITKDITLRIQFSAPSVNKFDQIVITHSFQSVS